MATRTIKVGALARVEGEGALRLEISGGQVTGVGLDIYEPPRFFEALLQGRHYSEAPDITARICGICPVAYQMSAVHAIENAAGVVPNGGIRDLRRLIYCGEWIESHALHIHMLHAPDFLECDSAVEIARTNPDAVERGLAIKRAGNALIRIVGGREIHPVNVRVGGFYRAPKKADLAALYDDLRAARDAALETLRWAAGFEYPDFSRDIELVALRHDTNYPMAEGRLVSTAGLDVESAAFEDVVEEQQVPHSTALHALLHGSDTYLTGPLARFVLNADRLTETAHQAAQEAGLDSTCRNPYRSILARGVEIVLACDEALRLIEVYEAPNPSFAEVSPAGKSGAAGTEAPRGVLFHRYTVGADERIESARIVPPTSQNQRAIEDDIRAVAMRHIDDDDDTLRRACEFAIRNHDPCISCATHFLTLDVVRR